MSSLAQPFLTPEEYLEAERKAEFRSEYIDGEMYAMSGASPRHSRITVNLLTRLNTALEGGPCQLFNNDLKVRVRPKGPFFYPDLVVVCGPPVLMDLHEGVLLKAKVIIEVLSPSTEAFDRGKKFRMYQELDSLAEYVLVAQDRVGIDHFVVQPNGHWDYSSISDLDGILELPSIGVRLNVRDIYKGIAFE